MAQAVLHRLDVGAAADEQGGLGVAQLVKVVALVAAATVALDPVAVVPGLDLLEGAQAVVDEPCPASLVEGGGGDEVAVSVVAAHDGVVGNVAALVEQV